MESRFVWFVKKGSQAPKNGNKKQRYHVSNGNLLLFFLRRFAFSFFVLLLDGPKEEQ